MSTPKEIDLEKQLEECKTQVMKFQDLTTEKASVEVPGMKVIVTREDNWDVVAMVLVLVLGTQNQLNMLQGPNAQNTTINLGGPANEQQTKSNQVSIFSLQNQSTQSESVATVIASLQNNNQFNNQNISTVGSFNLSLTSLANPLAGQFVS